MQDGKDNQRGSNKATTAPHLAEHAQDAILDTLHAARALGEPVPTTAVVKRTSSPWRANRLLGRIIPLILSAFILSGWHYVVIVLPPYLRETRSPTYKTIYLCCFNFLIASLYTLFLLICFWPNRHSTPPPKPPAALLLRTVPFECIDESGSLAACWQDQCSGRWMPPRTRHCKDCRVCRVEFDHCCPWFGPNCISRDTVKAFILFLALVAPTILAGLLEVAPIAIHHVKIVKEQHWESSELYRAWWSRWYSWLGGPLFRWGGGVVWCYRYYRPSETGLVANPLPAPSLGPLIWTLVGSLLAILTFFLMLITVKNILDGTSTLEIERAKIRRAYGRDDGQRYVWIPGDVSSDKLGEGDTPGRVLLIPKDAKLYDFGWKRNFIGLFGSGLASWLSPWRSGEQAESWQINLERLPPHDRAKL